MDDIQKCRIRLTHWIDHNRDHLKGYLEVLEVLEREGLKEPAEMVRRSIDLIEQANEKLDQALTLFRGPESETDESQEDTGHKHSHEHSHH